VAEEGLSPAIRLAVCASVFLAGLILAIAWPIERSASATSGVHPIQPEPTPTPDPQPDPNPGEPDTSGTVSPSSGSSGSSSGDMSVGSSSGSGSTASSAAGNGSRAVAPSGHARQAMTNPREREAKRAAAGATHDREHRAGPSGLTPPRAIGASPTAIYLEALLLILAGALALLLTLAVRAPSNRLAGVSPGLEVQRGVVAALIAVLLFAMMLGLFVVHAVSQL
jgi:hypothetical protein